MITKHGRRGAIWTVFLKIVSESGSELPDENTTSLINMMVYDTAVHQFQSSQLLHIGIVQLPGQGVNRQVVAIADRNMP